MTATAQKKQLTHSLIGAIIAILIALVAAASATFAWYIYNTGNRTSEITMAAGTSDSIVISNERDGEYGTSAVVQFEKDGALIPVSTTKINGGDGFRVVKQYTYGDTEKKEPRLLANAFGPTERVAYLKETLYIKNTGNSDKVYNIFVEDIDLSKALENKDNPISSAIRIGLVVGDNEYIFEANDEDHIQTPVDNTANVPRDPSSGKATISYAINPATDQPVEFTPYNSKNFYSIKENADNSNAKSIGSITGSDVLPVDVYVWLEGCDADCTGAIGNESISNFSIKFVGALNTK